MRRLQLYAHTLRHLKWRQVPARIGLRARRWTREHAPAVATKLRHGALKAPRPAASPFALRGEEAPDDGMLLSNMRQGRWTFLDVTADLGVPTDWAAPGQSQLWRYHLHYFDDLPGIVLQGEAGVHTARALVEDWIARVPCGAPRWRDPWHPYVASLRLVNWLLADALCPGVFAASSGFERSLREHSVFVATNQERDVGGNHLLKNLKAIAVAAVYWQTWQAPEHAVAAFSAELETQILLDGVHYERSPMYHCQVLGDALELAGLLLAAGHSVPGRLARCCARLQAGLTRLSHPDGDIALLGDSAFGMTPSPAELTALFETLSGRAPSTPVSPRHRGFVGLASTIAFPQVTDVGIPATLPVHGPTHSSTHSGVVKLSGGPLTVLADVGAACPDELPAHAQADTFSFELSMGDTRMIVDAGVSEYQAGPWRAFARSTRAHNTVEIDGSDSTECWGSFRAARRARVQSATYARSGSRQCLEAEHHGYTRLASPVTHRRRFELHDDGVLVVRDHLEGRGTHACAVLLHLHPEATIEWLDAGVRIRRDAQSLVVTWAELPAPQVVTAAMSPVQGWYSSRFGERQPAPVLVWSMTATLPRTFAVTVAAAAAGSQTRTVLVDERLTTCSPGPGGC